MKCPICNKDYYGNIKTQGVVYRKRHIRELKGDIWVCNECYRSHREYDLIEKIKDLDPAEIYDTPVYEEHHGVEGWLLFFILTLTIFQPLLTGYNLIADYNAFSPYLNLSSALDNLVYSYLISTIALVGVGFYAGISLWTLKPYAVHLAKRYLWGVLAYTLILIPLPTFFSLAQKFQSIWTKEVWPEIIRGIVYFVIWFAYLSKSVRVKETYLIRGKAPSFDPEETPTTADEKMAEMEDQEFSSLLHMGKEAIHSGRYEVAIATYKEIIRQKPESAEAHYSLGLAHLALGNRVGALDEYKVLKELDLDLANELFDQIYKD